MSKTEKKAPAGNKFTEWVKKRSALLLVCGGILLIVLSMGTQTVLITDAKNEEYTVSLKYSVFGYCVTATPMTEAAQAVATEHMFILDGTEESVLKTAKWIESKAGGGVEIFVNGYPRGGEKLTGELIEMLKKNGISAVKLETDK